LGGNARVILERVRRSEAQEFFNRTSSRPVSLAELNRLSSTMGINFPPHSYYVHYSVCTFLVLYLRYARIALSRIIPLQMNAFVSSEDFHKHLPLTTVARVNGYVDDKDLILLVKQFYITTYLRTTRMKLQMVYACNRNASVLSSSHGNTLAQMTL
jgi:hypothetical protein